MNEDILRDLGEQNLLKAPILLRINGSTFYHLSKLRIDYICLDHIYLLLSEKASPTEAQAINNIVL